MKFAPVSNAALGLVSVKVMVLVPPGAIGSGAKLLAIVIVKQERRSLSSDLRYGDVEGKMQEVASVVEQVEILAMGEDRREQPIDLAGRSGIAIGEGIVE